MEHGKMPRKMGVFGLGNRRSIRLSYGTASAARSAGIAFPYQSSSGIATPDRWPKAAIDGLERSFHGRLPALFSRQLHRSEDLAKRGGMLVEGGLRAPLRELDETIAAKGDRPDLDRSGLAVIGDRRIYPFRRVDAGESAGAFLDAGLIDLQPLARYPLHRLLLY